MADLVKYIDTDVVGGDGDGTSWENAYASLSAWEAAQEQDLTDGDGDTMTVHCRASSGTADTITTAISGWTTSETCYITIIGNDFPADGVFDVTKYRLAIATAGAASNYTILLRENYLRIVNYQIQLTITDTDTGFGPYVSQIDAGGSDIRIDSCIVKGVCSGTGGGYGITILDADATVNIFNSTIYGFNPSPSDSAFYGVQCGNAAVVNILNCTISGNYYGIRVNAGTVNIINCAIFNNVNDYYYQAGTVTIDYCATDDGDGTHAQDFTAEATDWNKVFEDYTTGDFRLKDYTTSPCCVGVGTDNPGEGLYSDDITGTARTSTWDIGAFEYIAGGEAIPLSGVVDIACTTAGALDIEQALSGTVNAACTTSGALGIKQPLSGVVNAVCTTTGALDVKNKLSGTANAVCTTVGTIVVKQALSGTVACVCSTTAALGVDWVLSGTVDIVCSISGALDVDEGGEAIPLSGAVSAACSTSGTLVVKQSLSGTVAIACSTSGALHTLWALSGVVNIVCTTTGNVALGEEIELAGVVAITCSVTGALDVSFWDVVLTESSPDLSPRFGGTTIGDDANNLNVGATGIVTLVGSAKRILTLRAEVNVDEIKKEAVPDQTQVGIFFGYSMPIYAADHEELYFRENIPGRWDGASDIIIHFLVALVAGEDIGDKFNFQFSWNQASGTEILPAATHDVTVETTIVDNTQHATYEVTFILDYDVDVGDVVLSHDLLAGRLRRVAASSLEATGEIIVLDWHTHYQVDKVFKAP